MKLAVDTNILVRAVLQDDEEQARAAIRLLREASSIAIPLPCLCELAWILRRGARRSKAEIVTTITALINARNVIVDRPAVEAGLAMQEAGGDFADGVIAFDGRRLGGECFVSFDRGAVARLTVQGVRARLLAPAGP